MMVEGEDFQDTPLGGFAGEALPPAPPQPKPKPQQGLVIEPPPWHGQDGKLDLGKPAANRPPDSRDALSEMKLANGEEFPEMALQNAPPLRPLAETRWTPPPPDWRREEAERVRREGEVEHESSKSLQSRPA